MLVVNFFINATFQENEIDVVNVMDTETGPDEENKQEQINNAREMQKIISNTSRSNISQDNELKATFIVQCQSLENNTTTVTPIIGSQFSKNSYLNQYFHTGNNKSVTLPNSTQLSDNTFTSSNPTNLGDSHQSNQPFANNPTSIENWILCLNNFYQLAISVKLSIIDDLLNRANRFYFYLNNHKILIQESFFRNILNTSNVEDLVFKENSKLELEPNQKICLYSCICNINKSLKHEFECMQRAITKIKENVSKYELENELAIKKDEYLKKMLTRLKNEHFTYIEDLRVKMIKVRDQILMKNKAYITKANDNEYTMNIE